MTKTSESKQPLTVIVSGGGPVGLTFSLHLSMMMGEHVKIIIYEGRWFVDEYGKIRWQGEKQGKIRRDQVVTLQDHVIDQMPEYIRKGLFKYIDERVWPTSRNIPIREVEDRLLSMIQPFVQNGQIELIPENLHEQSEHLILGNFDVLVGTDGSNSFVRRYCNIQMISEGVEYACGVAYNIPKNASSADQPLHQSLNCILTVSQTRYLVNSSESCRGYLNIRLIQDEYNALCDDLQQLNVLNEPLDLTDYDKCPNSPVWTIIRQGLEFFKISSKYVFRVVPIEINVRHASIVVRELRFEIPQTNPPGKSPQEKQYKTALAFLAGDAAMNVHFWPGRGMNSGMKAAMALARNILRSCTTNNSIDIRLPLRFLNFLDYEGFMARLRAREQQGRSLRVLINPVDECIQASYSFSHSSHCYRKYTSDLLEKLKETRDRLQERPEWPHELKKITDEELRMATKRILAQAVAQLSLANPWPTREMSGAEVLVEETFPYDINYVLPLPNNTILIDTPRLPTEIVHYRNVILWIKENRVSITIDNLINYIRDSRNFCSTSTRVDPIHQLFDVKTIEEAKQWIDSHQTSISECYIRFKIITSWMIEESQTAVDVIKAIRSKVPRVPVLVFTNKDKQTQAALEFPNVIVTDKEYDVKEFVGVNQESQWDSDWQVTSTRTTNEYDSSISTDSSSSDSYFDVPCRTTTFQPISMLLWIDSDTNDPDVVDDILKKYSTLQMDFRPTFQEAETYLNENLHDIKKCKKFIVITHGYYQEEKKSFVDIFRLLEHHQLENVSMAVYTKSKEVLLEKNPGAPEEIEIFEEPNDLLFFLDRHLNQ